MKSYGRRAAGREALTGVAEAPGEDAAHRAGDMPWPVAARIECLALAVERRTDGMDVKAIVEAAEDFYRWVAVGSFNLTPEQAQAKIRELDADAKHRAALQDKKHPGYQRAKETMEALYKIAYPEQAGGSA